ncbi:MAG: xanthine dehydrogenase family protein molybdopterin-binding subunit, partial [Chloroflexi bacterium]|nr:xanthine dehydrogenase family protein molybdopterin-binding subunit [Chloroflexota bacterium]
MATYAAVGKRVVRRTAPQKVTGNTMYSGDVVLPRMTYIKIFRSAVAHGRIKRLDVSKARLHDGVIAVLTSADLPAHLPRDGANRLFTVLADREVVFHGQPVAAVVAETPYQAEEALDLIEVEYEELPATINLLDAVSPNSAPVRYIMEGVDRAEARSHSVGGSNAADEEEHAPKISNVTQRMVFSRGDVEKGFAEADYILERSYDASWVHQGYIEPMAATVDYDPSIGEWRVWTSTQGNFGTREGLGKILGVPETKITVEFVEMGGGFGAKIQPFAAAIAAICAKHVGRPVRIQYSRSEDLRAADPAPGGHIEIKAGVKKDGTFSAMKARVVFDSGSFPGSPLMSGCNLLGGYYRFPNLEIEGIEVITNKVSQGALRAPGTPQVTFAVESHVNQICEAMGWDPVEFRLQNAVVEGDPMPNGRFYTRIGLIECLQALKETEFWKNRNNLAEGESVGFAVGGWLGGLQPAAAIVTLSSDGTMSVQVGANDISGTNTSFVQIAAEVMGLPVDRIGVRTGNTSSAPYAGITGGSKTLRTIGAAVMKATEDAKDQMFRICAERLEANPADLEVAEGKVRVKGSPEKAITFELLASMTQGFGATYPTVIGRGNTGSPTMAPGFTAQGVKLHIDPLTAEVTIRDAVVVQDVGFAINPATVETQLQGGMFQSLGIGYSEEMIWNDRGILANPTLLDYRIPVALDIPKIEVKIVEVPTGE